MKAVQHNNHSLNNLTLANYSIVHYAALQGDVETMQILEQACVEGLRMDDEELEWVWGSFDQRDQYLFPQYRAPLEVEEAALQALIDSVIPTEYATSEDDDCELSDAIYMPGAFPIDLDDTNCDSQVSEALKQDDNYGEEEVRDSDDESGVTPYENHPSGEERLEAVSDDGDDT
ncbi:hypothetical protein J4E85_007570 [Alternaria conjuncta]|uniref:uncharacterized protein n=1 Tax=Alternaria conjuncta TaxID=181017 RepID=UPI00221EF282|nr:uncharacterized protein J4E85_007570 [Alternaria conjuncta]KAI4925691.1 hypothetical protein J4E85_007570 [Alternaria conjuncta]